MSEIKILVDGKELDSSSPYKLAKVGRIVSDKDSDVIYVGLDENLEIHVGKNVDLSDAKGTGVFIPKGDE